MKETYEVYESNLAGLVKRLTALSLRSIKLGGAPILLEVGAPKDIAHPTTPNRMVRVFAVFAQNPEQVAAQYGRMTGCCSFCDRKLKDSRSVEMGYGPVCAGKFGLDWGTKKAVAA
jgi:hypothetical protein